MSTCTWNYRICRWLDKAYEEPVYVYDVREVYYDTNGDVRGWTNPITFVGDTPGEVIDALIRASRGFSYGVLDLDTRQTVHLTAAGLPAREKK